MESEKETNRLNSDDTKPEQDEEHQQRGECCDHQNAESQINGKEILKAIQIVEKDSMEIAESFTSLFASLRSTLSEVTSTSVDHMNCFGDAAGRVQECALDAATKGNRYINSCLRLNEEMKGIDNLATQLYPFHVIMGSLGATIRVATMNQEITDFSRNNFLKKCKENHPEKCRCIGLGC